jgi:Zn-dependent peptidase ImmA (M78 family)
MINESTKRDIEEISKKLLTESKSLGVFPTPVNLLLNYSELVLEENIDLHNIDKSFFDKIINSANQGAKVLQSGLSKVKGFFDRSEKSVYIDMSQSDGRQNFTKLHEIGHSVLPWQDSILMASDDDNTLSTFDDEFEAEANYFASVTLFQHDLFLEEISKLPFGLPTAMQLSKKFGSSVHSALRNYVIQTKNRCALLVLTPIRGAKGNGAVCEIRNMFYSSPFINEFGKIKLPKEFGYTWEFIKDYRHKKRYKENGVIEIITEEGEIVNASYHFFNNSYNVFVFLFPKGEHKKSKVNLILQNIN